MPERFDRFTEGARRALGYASEEASRFGHNYIGTEHLLLGLLHDQDEAAARALAKLGLVPSKVRPVVEMIVGRGTSTEADPSTIGLTPRARAMIELAIDEARQLNHHAIGTEHLLLGIVREGQGIAAGVIESLHVSLAAVRQQVLLTIAEEADPAVGTGKPTATEWIGRRATPTPPEFFDPPETKGQPTLFELRRVIPVAQTRVVAGTTVTLLSLEMYEDGFLTNVRLLSERPGISSRFPRLFQRAQDDLGASYRGWAHGGSGTGGQWRLTHRFAPPLVPPARELRLDVTAVQWRSQGGPADDLIQSGPWTFAVPLEE